MSLLAECCSSSYMYISQTTALLCAVSDTAKTPSGLIKKHQQALHSPSFDTWNNANLRYQFTHVLTYGPTPVNVRRVGKEGIKSTQEYNEGSVAKDAKNAHYIIRVQDQQDALCQVGFLKGEARINQNNSKPTYIFYVPNKTIQHQEHKGPDRKGTRWIVDSASLPDQHFQQRAK